ncbi:aldose epimerase family protein [Daejeonella sp. JGW-45]|uniref:aldose epimerase family protein n=1 Tax=Daejeonella sp. JGW-45 TaxID=3034148 RepID=UPI0023EBCD6D|nr:aldose epimerase family protein [Daejeonella sp. JGW-45]
MNCGINGMYTSLLIFTTISFMACTNNTQSSENMDDRSIRRPDMGAFSKIIDGKKVSSYEIGNGKITAYFTNYGARITGLWVPDKRGVSTDVVVGFGNIEGYLKSTEPYFGATIGRYGNRIAKGKFTLDGTEYQIPLNNGQNALHGGIKGFQGVVWDVEQPDERTLIFTYLAKDGEEGFPGNLTSKVTYSVTDNDEVKMVYEASTDKKTVVNLTNHAFFNLNGEGSGEILDHAVQIFADKFSPVDSTLIPTGELRSVSGTPFDFLSATSIGKRINADNEQLKFGKGYDHNYILSGKKENGMLHAATVIGDKSGIKMDIFTQEPGMQFYSGNFMQGKNQFKNGSKDEFRTAFAMETQHFPDSPNQPSFPTTVLSPGEKYRTISIYKFSTEK